MIYPLIQLYLTLSLVGYGLCLNRTFGIKDMEETSPKYVITWLTSSPSSSPSEVHWLETLSPAERIAIILAITILLIIVLAGLCYNGSVLCKCHRQRNTNNKNSDVNNNQPTSTQEQTTHHQGNNDVTRQRQPSQSVPQVVIYNAPNISTVDSSRDAPMPRALSMHMSHDRMPTERYTSHDRQVIADTHFPIIQQPDSNKLGIPHGPPGYNSLSHSAPDLRIIPPSPEYVPKLSISKSNSFSPPSLSTRTKLFPTAPPGDGFVFFGENHP